MKGRKLIALALCAALALGLAGSALAEQAGPADQALLAVTAKVKAALDLDTEKFQDFQGRSQEDALLGVRWDLTWTGDGADLSITADDSGKVYAYVLYESSQEDAAYYGGKLDIPRLPQDQSAQALAVAQSFLDRVLEAGVETAALEPSGAPSLRQTSYRFYGRLLLNGLPSPISCTVVVRAGDLAVTRFSRGDQYAGYLGGVPAPDTSVTPEQARALLGTTLSLKAQYVLEPGSKTAVLRYVPVAGDDYYVDGATGQLVNLDELYRQLWQGGGYGGDKLAAMNTAESADTAAGAPEAGLTQAERDGAALLAGAMSKEALDAAVRNAWPEIGLQDYTLTAARYSLSEKPGAEGQTDYDVTCRLTYGQERDQFIRNKTVTVDAKTGALKSLFSSRSYRGEGEDPYRIALDGAAAQAKAQAALNTLAGPRAEQVALAQRTDAKAGEGWEHLFTYQHTDGTYFYPDNYYAVGVDGTDGTLSRLESAFDDQVTLQRPGKVVDQSQAAGAYLAALEVPYSYLEVPVSISLAPQEVAPLLKEAGYNYVTALKPGYTLAQPENAWVEGVYAESGQAIVVPFDPDEPSPIAYDDLAGHWAAPAAQALAVFGVGLRGGSLEPSRSLTQRDMVALLASVDGYAFDPAGADDQSVDQLYRRGYALGLVTPETRDEDRVLTRGELVKVILDAGGYGRVAALPGIFRCDFSDAASLTGDTLGYAALAQGLGLVNGGPSAAYAPDRPVTRAEAVAMLYQYMK